VRAVGSSPEVTLAAFHLRKGARFTDEYDLNIPWRHEVRIEDHITVEPGKTYPRCTGGGGACPPEDCGGPEGYLAGLDEAVSAEAFEDWGTLIEILDQVVQEGGCPDLRMGQCRVDAAAGGERLSRVTSSTGAARPATI